MRVRMGWSGETASNIWQKVDIELEQEDLERIFRENDLPTELIGRLPTKVCFQLVQNEAEFLLLTKLRTLGMPTEQYAARQADLIAGTTEIVTAIKQQLAPA